MAELTVALTYGSALFQAAKEVGKIGIIKEETEALLDILKSEPDLRAFLNTPAIAAREKKAVISKIFADKICVELLDLLYILIDKGRTRHFQKIVDAYNDMVNKESGLSYGKIMSAAPLDESRLLRFSEETGKLLKLNVKLENVEDGGLIGGVKIYIDGKVIDASVKGRLKDLKHSMQQ